MKDIKLKNTSVSGASPNNVPAVSSKVCSVAVKEYPRVVIVRKAVI